jgi:predicted nucleotidyltransferase
LTEEPKATLILYGSYARGDYRSDSDIDILILLDKDKITYEDQKRISSPLYRIELETGILISPNFYSKNEWRKRITPFFENVSREGILLRLVELKE